MTGLGTLSAYAQHGSTQGSGWYNASQATAGARDYGATCASCHGQKLEGGAGPTLKGSAFLSKWQGKSLADLWEVVHAQMPLGAPGSLTEEQSLGVLSYILQANGYAAGDTPLKVSALDKGITAPEGEGAAAPVASAPPVVPVRQPSTNGPTQTELDKSDADPRHWLTYNKGYEGYRYSTLDRITGKNAGQLKVVCAFQLGEVGPFHNGPIVYDGMLVTTTAHGTYAIDASNCKKIWENQYVPWGPEVTNNSKGAAIAGGRVIRGTQDGTLIALDAKTGALLWLRQIMDPTNGEFATAAPLVWNDLVFIGKAGGDRGMQGEMMAFKAADGAKVWGFNTVPNPGDPGSETWKDPESIKHGGGATWTAYSLHAQTGLLLVPVGNPGPDFNNEVRPGTNLFTNSVIALDARTGQLKWWHQLLGPDDHDWDTAVVSTFDTRDGQKVVAAAGKNGVLHVVDRADGKLRFKTPIATQLNTTATITEAGIRICPIAAVQWNGPAYSPLTNLIYINSIDWCAQVIKGPVPKYVKGQEYLGWKNGYGTRDPVEKAIGWVNAVDAKTGEMKWRYKSAAPMLGAITATAGGVVFTGDTSGDFLVVGAAKGDLLYRFNTGGAIGGGVITYEIRGKQYVAVASGNTSRDTYGSKGSATIFVFGL
jgi:alcohol dehydrogenase (cytochrome c)